MDSLSSDSEEPSGVDLVADKHGCGSREPKKARRFTEQQKTIPNARYSGGMKGVGRQYPSLIEAAVSDTGLTTTQIEVIHYERL